MTSQNEDGPSRQYASPPCLAQGLDPQQALEVGRWRKAERVRLLTERAAMPVAVRRSAANDIEAHLERYLAEHLGNIAGLTISAWWPIKAEIDLRPWLGRLAARGAHAALPVVVKRAQPMLFRRWSQDTRMEPGVWCIPVPAESPECRPDVCLVPLVGWDAAGYRLGYGGGYFDRTLAALSPGPKAIGIGLQSAQVPTIFPQVHDISMAAIVTEAGLVLDSHQSRWA